MANWGAIRAVSEGLRSLIEAARTGTPFATLLVSIAQTEDFGVPPSEGITIYLYRVAINGTTRNLSPRMGRDGRRYRPSLPLDLHYLVTPWAKTATRQQELLGWSMRALEDHPILSTDLLNKTETCFRDGEAVDVVAQTLSPIEWVAIWEFNKAVMRPSMTYVARMIQLDSELGLQDLPRIQTRGVEATKAKEVP